MTPTSFVSVLRRKRERGGVGRYEVIGLEPFFAFMDVFGEILRDGYNPKRLVWSHVAVAKIRVRIVRKRRDAHAKLKSPAAKFPLRALGIIVKLAHAKAHEMVARL